ncbi:MAG: hypothetical protein CVU84_16025 [Firmicutes bacterium HGW-Firmicutes-1]|jgi:hypothetical protein|nr:MAG: hypothetical protein CVU84_16025 [Firmicutes bacterium HGW-Firmicutes-1]
MQLYFLFDRKLGREICKVKGIKCKNMASYYGNNDLYVLIYGYIVPIAKDKRGKNGQTNTLLRN